MNWMEGWKEKEIGEWIEGWIGRLRDGRMDGWTGKNKQIEEQMDGRMIDGKNKQIEEWMDGRMDGKKAKEMKDDGWIDWQANGCTDGKTNR